MKVESVMLEGDLLILHIEKESRHEAQRFVDSFKPGDYEVTKAKKKRSLDANAYCWALCQQIGQAVQISNEEVYRRALRDGNSYKRLQFEAEDVDDVARVWQSKGIGWFIVVEGYYGENPTMAVVHAYYGSSVFDTKEMAALIDNLVQEAENLGLDVMSERERSLLLEDWGHGK